MSVCWKDLTQNDELFTVRGSVVELAETLLNQYVRVLSEQVKLDRHAYSSAHFSRQAAEIEYVCRLLWLAVPAKHIHLKFNQLLAKKIINGTNPCSRSFWQFAQDFDQRVVEMSAIAMAIVEAPEIYWLPLTATQKRNLSTWLLSATHVSLPANNWRWFKVFILESLSSMNMNIHSSELECELQAIKKMQLQQGWYEDGATGVMDYYNSMAFQLYALMYCRWNPESPHRDNLLGHVLEFAQSYCEWFGKDGKQLAYGRSLNYRFAALAFWAELARVFPHHEDLPQWRTLWSQGMNWWASQPIFDSHGLLLPGYAYPNSLISEFYTSAASPILAYKAFNALALDEDHPFWQVEAVDLAEQTEPRWLNDRHLQWRNQGSYLLTNAAGSSELRECADKYYKFAYSSSHGFCIDSVRWINQGWVGDNILAFQHPDTMHWYSRQRHIESRREGDCLVSRWAPFSGCIVTTYQHLEGDKEIRVHRIVSDRTLSFLMTGYCVNEWRNWFSHTTQAPSRIESKNLFSELRLIRGPGQSYCYPCAPNSNLLYPHSSVPAISGVIQQGNTEIEVHVLAGNL